MFRVQFMVKNSIQVQCTKPGVWLCGLAAIFLTSGKQYIFWKNSTYRIDFSKKTDKKPFIFEWGSVRFLWNNRNITFTNGFIHSYWKIIVKINNKAIVHYLVYNILQIMSSRHKGTTLKPFNKTSAKKEFA